MKNIKAWQVVVPLMVIGLAGCDFSKPGDGEYWSDSYNWVNFSGSYKNPNGGAVVVLPGTPAAGGTNTVTETVDGEGVGSLNGIGNYSGSLAHQSIVPGSLQLSSADWTFHDDGFGNLVTLGSDFTGTGHIFYASGVWSLDTKPSFPPSVGGEIKARYQYTLTSTVVGGNSDVINVYALTLLQEGNLVNMTDSNGSQYSGKLGSVSGSNGSVAGIPLNGDQVIAQYKMTGRNNLTGRDVEIVGTLQGSVVRSGAAYYLANRTMGGTWMESDGTTLDIIGVAGQVGVTVPTTTP